MDEPTKEQIVNACIEALKSMSDYRLPEPIDVSSWSDQQKAQYLIYRMNNRP